MNTERANTKLYLEYLKTHEIINQHFIITFERVHTTSGTIVFQRKSDGQLFKGKFIILNINIQGRIDILVVLLKHKFHLLKQGVKQSSNFLTCEAQYFQEEISNVYDII